MRKHGWMYAEERMYIGWGGKTVNNPHTAATRPTTKDFLCLSNPCPPHRKLGWEKCQRNSDKLGLNWNYMSKYAANCCECVKNAFYFECMKCIITLYERGNKSESRVAPTLLHQRPFSASVTQGFVQINCSKSKGQINFYYANITLMFYRNSSW